MKTKLFILAGITLAILSGVAVAEKKFSLPQSSVEVVVPDSLEREKPEPPLVITKDINVLKGKGFFFIENGVLYKEAIALDGTLATTSKVVATGSIRLVDQSDDLVLFTKDLTVGSHDGTNELWTLDKKTGVTKKVRDNVVEGDISPSGEYLVVRTTSDQLIVCTKEGSLVTKIGLYGVSPIFSPNGDKIAYIKLKDEPVEMGDLETFQGVAVYDFVTGRDSLILKTPVGGNEWMIAGWSPNGKRIYFPSAGSTWSVSLDGTGKRQETNKTFGAPPVPAFLDHLLFADDGITVFGEAGGLWTFHLGKNGEFLGAKKVVAGDANSSSRLDWFEKGKSINVRLYGQASTTVYRLSDLKR